MSFDTACSLIDTILTGDARQALVADLAAAPDCRSALERLRDSMRSHAWKAGAQHVALGRIIKEFDAQTRREGFHVLNDWDGRADRVNDDSIPVDVLNYVIALRGAERPDPAALAMLIDYYFANVLALLALRIWDTGDADANLDCVNGLLQKLQGPDGSGQPFAADAETLILLATSHFEVVEIGYEDLLARVRTLSRGHQLNIAVGHAVSMGSHLRFGFEATYARDTVVMRDDNVADYPWLCWALATVMREYAEVAEVAEVRLKPDTPYRSSSRSAESDDGTGSPASARPTDRLAEALINGLSSDPRAFLGQAPNSLSAAEADRSAFAERFATHRSDLLDAFERYRPRDDTYSPLSFFFNFSHNVLKGTVVDALLHGRPWRVSFNDLLTSHDVGPVTPKPRSGEGGDKIALARTLMGYARRNPDRIRGRLMPVIVYDPATGREAFSAAMRKLRL
jgi:hypothetical protein